MAHNFRLPAVFHNHLPASAIPLNTYHQRLNTGRRIALAAVHGYSSELVGHSVRVWTCSSWVFQLLSQFPYVFPSFSSFYVPTSFPHETSLQYILFCTLSVYLSLNINYDFPPQPQSPVSCPQSQIRTQRVTEAQHIS
jgi:hypothetical protein